MKIKPKLIIPPYINVVSPEGKVYTLNEYEFNELRVQIKTLKQTGWAYRQCNQNVDINSDGKCIDSPDAFELNANFLFELL